MNTLKVCSNTTRVILVVQGEILVPVKTKIGATVAVTTVPIVPVRESDQTTRKRSA